MVLTVTFVQMKWLQIVNFVNVQRFDLTNKDVLVTYFNIILSDKRRQ